MRLLLLLLSPCILRYLCRCLPIPLCPCVHIALCPMHPIELRLCPSTVTEDTGRRQEVNKRKMGDLWSSSGLLEGKYAPEPLKQGLVKIEFVPQGGKVPDRKKANKTRVSQSDVKWEIAADLKGCQRFFPIPTTKKPDLVIWNELEKEVHLVELTVPHEDNISSMHGRKDNRYEALVGECEEAGWKSTHSPVEVGCRGFIGTGITKWMRVAGLCPKKENISTKALQQTVEKASHWIWVKREDTS